MNGQLERSLLKGQRGNTPNKCSTPQVVTSHPQEKKKTKQNVTNCSAFRSAHHRSVMHTCTHIIGVSCMSRSWLKRTNVTNCSAFKDLHHSSVSHTSILDFLKRTDTLLLFIFNSQTLSTVCSHFGYCTLKVCQCVYCCDVKIM